LFLVRGIALIFQHRDALTHPPLCFGGHDIGMREIQNAANLKKGASEEKKSTSLTVIFKLPLMVPYQAKSSR